MSKKRNENRPNLMEINHIVFEYCSIENDTYECISSSVVPFALSETIRRCFYLEDCTLLSKTVTQFDRMKHWD